MRTAEVGRLEPRRRGSARRYVAAVMALVATLAGVNWYTGGERVLYGHGGGIADVVAPGETVYLNHVLAATGPVELRSVTPLIEGVGPLELKIEMWLAHTPIDESIWMRPPGLDGFDLHPVEGARIGQPELSERTRTLLVMSVTANGVGAWKLSGVEVSYRSGLHPPRTAVNDWLVCVLVADDPHRPYEELGAPSGVLPAHWEFHRACP